MILKNALELSKSIDHYRQDLYELARDKGFSDPGVVKISQELDEKIFKLQEIVYSLNDSS
jgi:Spo0E like sporulation regulatory protein